MNSVNYIFSYFCPFQIPPMTRPHPYRPPLLPPPVALIRVDTCDTRRCVFRGTRTAAAHHLRGRRWLHISTTVHCSLFTAHWSYTFSAKEKDVETGLSFFGSRYYSSDLSIWLSVDPMSDKYPSLSPYVYCADNPVRCVDPNGEKIVVDGDDASDVVTQINNKTSEKFNVFIDDNGNMDYSGKAKTKIDRFLKKAIKQENVKVIIKANNNQETFTTYDGKKYNYYKDEEGVMAAGAYGGSVYHDGSADSYQYVDPKRSADLDMMVGDNEPGGFLLHEIAEGYFSASIALKNQTSDPINEHNNYNKAHYKANGIMGGGWTKEHLELPTPIGNIPTKVYYRRNND